MSLFAAMIISVDEAVGILSLVGNHETVSHTRWDLVSRHQIMKHR